MYGVDTDMINIITVGKIKEKYLKLGIDEFQGFYLGKPAADLV